MKSVSGPFAILVVCVLLIIVLIPVALVVGVPIVLIQGAGEKARNNDATATAEAIAETPTPTPTIAVTPPAPITQYLDKATNNGAIQDPGLGPCCANGKLVTGLYAGHGGQIQFHVNTPVAGSYNLEILGFSNRPHADKTLQVTLNGTATTVNMDNDPIVQPIQLQSGDNTITISDEDGYDQTNATFPCNGEHMEGCFFITGIRVSYQN